MDDTKFMQMLSLLEAHPDREGVPPFGIGLLEPGPTPSPILAAMTLTANCTTNPDDGCTQDND